MLQYLPSFKNTGQYFINRKPIDSHYYKTSLKSASSVFAWTNVITKVRNFSGKEFATKKEHFLSKAQASVPFSKCFAGCSWPCTWMHLTKESGMCQITSLELSWHSTSKDTLNKLTRSSRRASWHVLAQRQQFSTSTLTRHSFRNNIRYVTVIHG